MSLYIEARREAIALNELGVIDDEQYRKLLTILKREADDHLNEGMPVSDFVDMCRDILKLQPVSVWNSTH